MDISEGITDGSIADVVTTNGAVVDIADEEGMTKIDELEVECTHSDGDTSAICLLCRNHGSEQIPLCHLECGNGSGRLSVVHALHVRRHID